MLPLRRRSVNRRDFLATMAPTGVESTPAAGRVQPLRGGVEAEEPVARFDVGR